MTVVGPQLNLLIQTVAGALRATYVTMSIETVIMGDESFLNTTFD